MISVHASSFRFDLRVVRSRVVDMLSRMQAPQDEQQLDYCLRVIDNMLLRIDRTGEYIASLEVTIDPSTLPGGRPASSEEGMGKEL